MGGEVLTPDRGMLMDVPMEGYVKGQAQSRESGSFAGEGALS